MASLSFRATRSTFAGHYPGYGKSVLLLKSAIRPLTRREYSSSSSNDNLEYQKSDNEPTNTIFDGSRRKRILQFKNDGNLYHEKVLIGYSRQQMCDLVFDVASYRDFLPFCINSEVLNEPDRPGLNLRLMKNNYKSSTAGAKAVPNNTIKREQSFKAKLEVGYPPIRESYVSHVTMIRPDMVKSISRDTRLFEFLINEWKFHPSTAQVSDTENSCIVEFYVSFKFRSVIYTKFATLFMDQVFKKMVVAFTNRASEKYGKASCEPQLITKHSE